MGYMITFDTKSGKNTRDPYVYRSVNMNEIVSFTLGDNYSPG